MKFFPITNFNISSPLTAEEAEARLLNLVTPQNARNTKYDGLIVGGQFTIEARAVNLRRPMLGIKGYVSALEKGSKVMVKVSPTGPGMIPIFVFLLFESMLIYVMFWGRGTVGNFYWMPLSVGFFGYLMFAVLVKYETGVYKKLLLKTLNGKLALKGNEF